jgi:Resolvase, N terminal domain
MSAATNHAGKGRPPVGLSRSAKIEPWHLDRLAVVDVRQSTPQQVAENRESTDRRYALAQRAVELGWPPDRIRVLDDDQGKRGITAEGRPGFQRLLAEVGLDHVGLILGLELSRLARSCADWQERRGGSPAQVRGAVPQRHGASAAGTADAGRSAERSRPVGVGPGCMVRDRSGAAARDREEPAPRLAPAGVGSPSSVAGIPRSVPRWGPTPGSSSGSVRWPGRRVAGGSRRRRRSGPLRGLRPTRRRAEAARRAGPVARCPVLDNGRVRGPRPATGAVTEDPPVSIREYLSRNRLLVTTLLLRFTSSRRRRSSAASTRCGAGRSGAAAPGTTR